MNVIVFALRGCPVGALGAYGNEWIGTPSLDRVAAEGVVFDQHIADCPDPAAARRAWRTGEAQTPPMHTAGTSPAARPASARHDLLALLKARGVRTVLVRNTRPANDAPAEFYAGWDDLFDARPDADLPRALPAALGHLAAFPDWLLWVEIDRLLPPWEAPAEVFEAYVEDLIEEGTEVGEAIEPWADPPAGWFDQDDDASWELLHRTFAAAVTVFDADLGRVFEVLRERGLDRSAAWVFTADHGLPLGEHGVVGLFRPWLHEELVHVPLIVRLPGGAEAGRRVSALTQPADLMPTVAGWFGVELPGGLDGLLHGTGEGRPFAASGLVLDGVGEWAIRTPGWALLVPGEQPEGEERSPVLFEKPDDRWEANDLRSRHLDRAEELEAQLRAALG